MSAKDTSPQSSIEVAERAVAAVDADDRDAWYALLDSDVEVVTPKRTLRGIDEVREELHWGSPEHLDREVGSGTIEDLGEGHLKLSRPVVLRWKETGEVAHTRMWHNEWTIRDGKIVRCAWFFTEG